jgi:hypothetical protein
MKRKGGLWVVLFGIPALLVLPIAIVGSGVYAPGTIDVQVVEKGSGGTSVGLHVPAMIVPAALHLLPECTVDDIRVELDDEARQALRIAGAIMEKLEECPDGVFVDVQDATDVVTIEKRNGQIHVYVDTPDETVRCSMPIGTLRSTIGTVAAI